MSWNPAIAPDCPTGASLDSIETLIIPRARDIGGFEVRRALPSAGRMMVFRPGDRISVQAGDRGARLMALGGETLNGPRHIWWNFVSSSRERLEEAKKAWHAADWENGPFRLPPGDDGEFIPAPER